MKKSFVILFLTISLFTLSSCQKSDVNDPSIDNSALDYYKQGEYKKALPLLEKSADAGNLNASYSPGEMYRKGEGVDKNEPVACLYYRKSAEASNQNAY